MKSKVVKRFWMEPVVGFALCVFLVECVPLLLCVYVVYTPKRKQVTVSRSFNFFCGFCKVGEVVIQ